MRKALIIVDVQEAFINKRNKKIIKSIQKLLKTRRYDLYIESVFHAEKGSLWNKQTGWICPKDENTHTVREVLDLLPKETIHIEKTTKSVFKGNKNLGAILKKNKIEEVHIVGLDTNDCILATAYESFDFGFFTYVIESCCNSSSSQKLHKEGIDILRHVSLTKK
ncbi:MAG: isochorismatase family cysteine hydrolase [Nanoarchaeota archaeon]|nr:isochorismatase family cysteine hydrolase [Nanoarchaeota archaeon]